MIIPHRIKPRNIPRPRSAERMALALELEEGEEFSAGEVI